MSSLYETAKEDMGCGPQTAGAVARGWDDEQDLVEFIANGNKPSEKTGVGSRTFQRIFDWIAFKHPDTKRSFYRENVAYATEYRARDDESFAFICPRCEATTSLEGDPKDFRNASVVCQQCRWVSCLEAGAIEEFIAAHQEGER